ncbi:MAG: CDP-glycerol glycerophosphotransferase family protein [Kiritimatiellae bacterium]|nr:CDP-glycerol glycerophosphotransferase family protein [Kiritimatiellia bacterium]
MIARLLSDALVERRFVKSIIHATDLGLATLSVRILRHFTKIRKNKIVFTNFSGTYDCNPKYICEEILRRKLPWEVVWVVWGAHSGSKKNSTAPGMYPPELVLTDRYSGDFYRHLFGAKVVVDNGSSFVSAKYPKKRGQFVLNTWHGSLGIKRFPKDDGGKGSRYNRVGREIGRTTDLIVSNSEFEEMYYKETYFANTPVKRLGHARNDLFFNRDPEFTARIQGKVRTALDIPAGTKICLYAPTFRDDHDLRPYDIPYGELMKALSDRFGGKWTVLTRFHFRTKKFTKSIKFPPGVVSATSYPDIHELMFCADVGITDYSSWICEYIHTRRPGFLFATDMAHYGDVERGFYDPLDKMPFPLSTDGDGLARSIREFDEKKYLADCDAFIAKKGCIDDGHAAERIVDLLEEIMKK